MEICVRKELVPSWLRIDYENDSTTVLSENDLLLTLMIANDFIDVPEETRTQIEALYVEAMDTSSTGNLITMLSTVFG